MIISTQYQVVVPCSTKNPWQILFTCRLLHFSVLVFFIDERTQFATKLITIPYFLPDKKCLAQFFLSVTPFTSDWNASTQPARVFPSSSFAGLSKAIRVHFVWRSLVILKGKFLLDVGWNKSMRNTLKVWKHINEICSLIHLIDSRTKYIINLKWRNSNEKW